MAVTRLITYFVGEDVSMKSTLNEIDGSLTNTGRRLNEMGRQGSQSVSMLGREFDRFKRHFGYATAGLATYEIFNAIGRLRDYQTELAQLNAVLGDTPGQLQQFGQAAIDISTRTAQPLNDVLQSMQNIAQSIPNMSQAVQKHLIPAMAQIEAMGARVSGTDPRSFGSTVLGLATAFYGRQAVGGKHGTDILESIANKLVTTQFTTPRVTGQDIATYIPMLAGGALTSGFTLDQMLSLFTVGQRIIQRPATTAQYLRQLMIRLHQPTKAEQPFFAQAGLGPEQLKELNKSGGGMTILRTILMHALSMPGNNLNGMTPVEFLNHPSWNKTTLSPDAAQFIQNTIGGRIQSLVAARAITAGLGQIPKAEAELRSAPTLKERFGDMNLSMQKASTALSNMATDIGTTFLPAIDTGSTVITHAATLVDRAAGDLNSLRSTIDQHTRGIPIVGGRLGGIAEVGALAAGAGAVSLLRGRGIGRFFRTATAGPLAAERGYAETQASANALAGVARGTYDAPFWVVIHPLSISQIPALQGGGFGNNVNNDGKTVERLATLQAAKRLAAKAAARTGLAGVAERLGLGGSEAALRVAGLGGAATVGYLGIKAGVALSGPSRPITSTTIDGQTYHIFHDGTLQAVGGGGRRTLANQFIRQLGGHNIPRGLQPYFKRFESGQLGEPQLNHVIQNYIAQTMRASGGHPQGFLQNAIMAMFRLGPGHQMRLSHVDRSAASSGYVEATLTLEPSQEFKNLLRPQQVRVHIPVSELPAPTARSKTRVPRRK